MNDVGCAAGIIAFLLCGLMFVGLVAFVWWLA
jgi:hypothetical protein